MQVKPILFSKFMVNSILKGHKTQTRRPINNKNVSNFQIGGLLWVRESFIKDGKNKPSIFMPKVLSRITLKIIDIRIENVKDISIEDAIAEGVNDIDAYKDIWNNMHNNWNANPQCFVIEFEPIFMNIEVYLNLQKK